MPVPRHSVFYRLDALPAAQPTVSKHSSLEVILQECTHQISLPLVQGWESGAPELQNVSKFFLQNFVI